MWGGKSVLLKHKSGNISDTREDRGKVTMQRLQELTNALSNGTIPDPLWPPLPQDWGFATPHKTPIDISGTGKAKDFRFGRCIHRIHPNKSPLKFWRKWCVGVSRDCPIFSVTPYYLRNGKATDFKFGHYIQRVHPNKSPLKILEKRERGRIQGPPNFFSGTPYYPWNG